MVAVGLALLIILSFPATADTFQSRMAYKPGPGNGVMVEVSVTNGKPFHLLYGLLTPPAAAKLTAPLVIAAEVFNPLGAIVLPGFTASCDVNYVWYGACERVWIGAPGVTRIAFFYSPQAIALMQRFRIEQILILIRHGSPASGDHHEVRLEELVRRAGEARATAPL